MARLILIPSEHTDTSQVGGSHFGRAKWYVLMNESGDVELAIPGGPSTGHGLIFKHLKDELPEAVLITGAGTHAFKVMEKWGVPPSHYPQGVSMKDATVAYFENKLLPFKEEEAHACKTHVH